MKTLIITAALTLVTLFASAQYRPISTVKIGCTLKGTTVKFNTAQLDSMINYNRLGYKVGEVRTINGVSHVILQKK